MSTPTVNTLVPSVYVGNNVYTNGVEQGQVLQFLRNATGSATPLATLTLPAGVEVDYLTTDSAGQIYVGGDINGGAVWEVLVYAAGASGSVAPLRTITSNSASFQMVLGLAVDGAGQVYVSSGAPTTLVAVMAANANGAATPVRVIAGPLTKLVNPDYAMAVDSSGTLYVANNSATGTILAFGPTANGNVAPVRTFTDATLSKSGQFGLDVDAAGNIYVSSILQVPAVTTYSTVSVFAAGASGAVAPFRTIAVDSGNQNLFTSALRVDSATGTIYLSSDAVTPTVFSYASGTSGTAAPSTKFSSTSWRGPGYLGIALR